MQQENHADSLNKVNPKGTEDEQNSLSKILELNELQLLITRTRIEVPVSAKQTSFFEIWDKISRANKLFWMNIMRKRTASYSKVIISSKAYLYTINEIKFTFQVNFPSVLRIRK